MNLLLRCCMLLEAAMIFGPLYVAGLLAAGSLTGVRATVRRFGRGSRPRG